MYVRKGSGDDSSISTNPVGKSLTARACSVR